MVSRHPLAVIIRKQFIIVFLLAMVEAGSNVTDVDSDSPITITD